MADSNPGPPQHVREIVDLLLREAAGLVNVQTKQYEGLVSFNEKLLLLNGGTLTLSLSVIANFAGHLPSGTQVQHLQSLIWAWRLLVISIACCLYLHAYMTNAIAHFGNVTTLTNVRATTERLRIAAAIPVDLDPIDEAIKIKQRRLKTTLRLAAVTGITAKFSTLVAFWLLLRFVQSNVEALLVHH